MSLDHIILGALEEPRSGYELKRWFDEVFAFFWNADQSQIYRSLNRLSDEGLLSVRAEASPIGPGRRVYRTTAKGRAEFRRWLREGPASPAQKSAIYAQLLFLPRVPAAEAMRFLVEFKAQSDQLAAALAQIPDDPAQDPDDDHAARAAFFNRASLSLGRARAQATQEFAAALLEHYRKQFPGETDDGHTA